MMNKLKKPVMLVILLILGLTAGGVLVVRSFGVGNYLRETACISKGSFQTTNDMEVPGGIFSQLQLIME